MARHVALFRGINVGTAKRIAMADLRKLMEALGYRDVQTLLNSGNVVFDGAAGANAKHAQRIRDAVAKKLRVDALVVVKSGQEMAAVVAGNKLAAIASNPSLLLVALTSDAKALGSLAALAKAHPGVFHLGKDAAYAWCPEGSLKSKVGVALLKVLADAGTTRNWATIEKLHGMLQGGGSNA